MRRSLAVILPVSHFSRFLVLEPFGELHTNAPLDSTPITRAHWLRDVGRPGLQVPHKHVVFGLHELAKLIAALARQVVTDE